MKKIVTILMMVIAIFSVGIGAYAQTYKYNGNIGEYGVSVTLTEYDLDCRQGFGCIKYVKGKYTYTKAGNTLTLKGSDWTMTNTTTLEEYTPKGRHSGTWELEGLIGDNVLKGSFTNLSNGKVFNVYLKKVK